MTTRRILIALGLGGALAMTSLAAGAHEMFLKPTNFQVAPNTKTEIALFNGTFDKSENPITRDRMRTVEVLAGGLVTKPAPSQWRDDEVTSYLDLTLGGTGTYVVGVSTAPKIIELSADAFEDYLRHDGIEDLLKARQAEKVPRTPVRERYSKHVKTILQVGATQTEDYVKPLGLPAEIVLLQNPAAVKVGDMIDFRALLKGQPMSGQLVYASFGGFQAADAQSGRAVKMRTDADGGGSFKVTQAGVWYITLINMQKATGEATYESNWATLTFEVR